MRFLPFINGKSFLVLYAIYAIVAIILLSRKINNNDSEYFVASSLDEEKYYVLKNKYSLQNMFYYITYKLYAKEILLKDEEDNKFYVNTKVTTYLSSLEEIVYCLYLDKFAPSDFKSNMVNESEFKEYYYSIYNGLIGSGFIKDSKIVKKNKTTLKIGMLIIFVPGIWRLIGGIVNEMPVTALIIEFIIIFVIAIVVLVNDVNNKLTNHGSASKTAYENNYKSIANYNTNSNDEFYESTMQGFLMGASWMYFLGVCNPKVNDIGSSSYYDNNCSDFSDSNDSGSSCSSCSSCGGCGGD